MDLTRLRWQYGGPKVAMAVALMVPLLPPMLWSLAAGVLLVTWSWLAFLAVAAGLVARVPSAWPYVAATGILVIALWLWSPTIAGRPLLQWTPRGDRNSTIWGRWTGIQLACLRLTWRGRGPGSMRRDLLRWKSRGVRGLPANGLYCEALGVVYDYGILGAVGLAVLVGLWLAVVPLRSPWAAVGVTFAVLSLGHAPTHYVARWLKRRFRRLIPQPPLLADLTIHVCSDGTFRLYREERAIPLTPYGEAMVAAAVIRAGKWIADEHGLTIEEIGLEAS